MLPGKLYELAIFTNTLINYPDKHFDLGQEIRIGDKFDDLVVRVDGDKYTFVQIKLVDDSEDNVIDAQVLLGEKKISLNKDDFKLQKYFLSYLRIEDQLNSGATTSTVQKLVIFTNADINDQDIKQEIGTVNIIRDRNDNILNNNESSKSDINVNVDSIFIQKLRGNLKCDLQILAEEVAKYVTDSNSNLDPMVLDIDCFRYYHTALFDEHVLEARDCQHGNKIIRLGKFTSNFIDGKDLSNRAHKLRTKIIGIVLEKQNNIAKLQEDMAKAEWKLSDDFGVTESKDVIFLPNYDISDKDVEDFFRVLELRVNQHGVKNLLKKIKNEEIRDKFLEYFNTDPKLVEFLINDFIQVWRSEKTAQERWLLYSKRSEFIKELQIKIAKPQAIHTTQKYVRYIERLIKQYNLRFQDSCLFNKKYFLGRQKEKYFLISTASNVLSSIKMIQYLNETKHQNYIFIDLDSLSVRREIIKLVDAFHDTKYSLLILSYKRLVADDIVNELFNKLSSITNEHTNKEVIFITAAADSLIKRFSSYKEYKDKTIAVEHFVDEAKVNILQQEVTFQSQAMPIGDIYDLIGPEVIDRLITNKIDIGSATSEINYLEGAYTEVFEEVNMESLRYELIRQSNDIYVISDISGSWKRCFDSLLNEMSFYEKATLNIIKSKIEELKQDSFRHSKGKIYISGFEFKYNDFKDLCKKNPKTKIYWINVQNDKPKSKIILAHIYNPKFYIKGRRFNKEVIIKRNIKKQLLNPQLQERFCIFGINKKQITSWLRLDSDDQIYFKKNYENNNIQLFASAENLIGICQKLEQRDIDETVHLLRFEQGHLIWCRTYGPIENLSKHRAEGYKNIEPLLDESDLINEIKDKKLVIIAGEPGIGKSTTLVKLCGTKFKLKSDLENSMMMSHWIIKVNLKDHVQLIRNIVPTVNDQISRMKVVQFLSQVDKSLNDDIAKSLLEAALTKDDFGKPLLVAFDGFDEILDKEDRDRVVVLLQQIRNNTTAKVWVTTRLHYENTLERKLSTFSIRLEAMNAGKVRKYIKTYFKDHLMLILSRIEFLNLFKNSDEAVNTGLLHEYTEAFLNKVYEILKSDVTWFIGTPLQLYLMLEGSVRYFKEWISNYSGQDPDFGYLGNDIWDVYEKFVERKYDTYIKKRDIKESVKQKLEKTVFDDFHRNLAKSSILESDVKKSFLGLKDVFLSAGIVKSDGNNVGFIHPTFQEYFAAKLFIYWIRKWSRDGQHKLTNLLKKAYLVEDILTKSYYQVIRAFINVKLSNEKFKYLYFDEHYYNEQIMLLAIKENNLGIVSFLLQHFQSIDVDNTIKSGWSDYSPLKSAAAVGNLGMFKLLVKYSANVHHFDELCSTYLHIAAESGNVELVKYMIENGADINSTDDFGETLLHKVAAQDDNFEMVRFFVQNHGDVNVVNCFGNVALYRAVTRSANLEVVKYLVQNGADVKAEFDNGESIMYKALIKFDNYDLVKFLLNNGIKIRAGDRISSISLGIATKYGDLELVQLLVNNGADVNSIDNTGKQVLFNAVDDPNKLTMVKYLMEKGAYVNVTDPYGETVLCKAVTHPGNLEMVKYLIAKGADVNVRDNRRETVIHKAVTQPSNIEIVKLLINIGVDIHSKNDCGEVPLSMAVRYGDLDIVKFLVQNGADVNSRNNNGNPIICYAVGQSGNLEMMKYLDDIGVYVTDNRETIRYNANDTPGNFEIVKFLIKHGVDVNARNNNGEIALFNAVKYSDFEIVKLLVQNGADVNATDTSGKSVLCAAVLRGNFEMVKFLGQNGANVHSRNTDGTTALHIAAQMNDIDAVKFLVQNGLTIENAKTEDDLLVLRNVAEVDNVDMLKFIIQHTPKIECLDEIYSILLHDATEYSSLEVVKYLVENGANVNAEDERGPVIYKAVSYTCRAKGKDRDKNEFTMPNDTLVSNQLEIIKFLLLNGAKVDVRAKDGVFVFKKATELRRLDILKFLVEYSANIGHLDNLSASVFRDAAESGNLDMVQFLLESCWNGQFC